MFARLSGLGDADSGGGRMKLRKFPVDISSFCIIVSKTIVCCSDSSVPAIWFIVLCTSDAVVALVSMTGKLLGNNGRESVCAIAFTALKWLIMLTFMDSNP